MQDLNNKTDGVPTIAEQARVSKVQIIAVIVVAVVVIGIYFFKSRVSKEVVSQAEESYTLRSEAVPVQKVVQAGAVIAKTYEEKQGEQVSKEVIAARADFVREKQQQLQQRLSAPLMLINSATKENEKSAAQDEHAKDGNPNTLFLQNAANKEVQTATATLMGSLSTMIAEGSFIHAILEPATNSDLPGSLRAIVSEPSYSEDGSRVLIPRGSRLIGEYKSGLSQGQARIFVVWNRLITLEGVSVQLGSAGVDSLGVAGMGADSVNRHFFERFGTASLLSMIGAGSATLGVSGGDQDNSAGSYRTAIANSFSQSANQSLQQEGMIAPTLKTFQGKPIMVFVAKDLQFDGVIKTIKPYVNIF